LTTSQKNEVDQDFKKTQVDQGFKNFLEKGNLTIDNYLNKSIIRTIKGNKKLRLTTSQKKEGRTT
jgi:hypothetical protein